jgi:hypothetical protein
VITARENEELLVDGGELQSIALANSLVDGRRVARKRGVGVKTQLLLLWEVLSEVDEQGILAARSGRMAETVGPEDMMAVGEEVVEADPSWIPMPLTLGLRSLGQSTKAQPLPQPPTKILVGLA